MPNRLPGPLSLPDADPRLTAPGAADVGTDRRTPRGPKQTLKWMERQSDGIASLGVSLENVHVVALLARLDLVTDHQLRVLSSVTFLLGGVFVTEGIGLFFKQRWAEYLTIVVTALFVPLELFESLKHFGTAKLVLLVVNVTIVCCLLWVLKKNPKTKSLSRHLH